MLYFPKPHAIDFGIAVSIGTLPQKFFSSGTFCFLDGCEIEALPGLGAVVDAPQVRVLNEEVLVISEIDRHSFLCADHNAAPLYLDRIELLKHIVNLLRDNLEIFLLDEPWPQIGHPSFEQILVNSCGPQPHGTVRSAKVPPTVEEAS